MQTTLFWLSRFLAWLFIVIAYIVLMPLEFFPSHLFTLIWLLVAFIGSLTYPKNLLKLNLRYRAMLAGLLIGALICSGVWTLERKIIAEIVFALSPLFLYLDVFYQGKATSNL